ncbi:hypothetical protein TorRG33x02_350540, partial [Trema orientale]
ARESYGEDIADTDTQRSDNSVEDEYEDSFIDDEDPKVFPPSPISNDGEESLDDKKPWNGKGNYRRRIRKKYQLVESDDEGHSPKKNMANGTTAVPVLESDDEDNFPIFSCFKNRHAKKSKHNGEGNADKGTDATSKKKTDDDGNYYTESKGNTDDIDVGGQPIRQSDLPVDPLPSEVGHRNSGISKKRKERSDGGKYLEDDRAKCGNILKEDKMQQREEKVDNNTLYLDAEDGQTQKMAHVNQAEVPNVFSPPSIDVGHESDKRRKQKRKAQKNEKTTFDVYSANLLNDVKENEDLKVEVKAASIGEDLSVKSEQNQKLADDRNFDCDSRGVADGNQSEEKKVKKKTKKKSKAKENGKAVTDTPLLSVEENNTSSIGIQSKNTEAITSQVQTLQNGLVVEELEAGKPDGKAAVSGKRISIQYVGKLKENGDIVDSNVGGDPYKFRLGAGKVIKGWDVGLEGMRVGQKRRLTVPPSMALGSGGHGENVPPNSWLVYEVELVKVH